MKTFFIVCLLCASSLAQMPSGSAALAPNPSQHKKLLAQRARIVSLQNQINRLQIEAAFETEEMRRTCTRIAVDNRWPAAAQCDLNSLLFYEVAPPMPAPPSVTPKLEGMPAPLPTTSK